jgi:hypothetical protein
VLAEFHDTLVLSYPADSINRLVLKQAERTLIFTRAASRTGGPADWMPDRSSGTDATGIDLSRFNDMVKQLAELRTTRFLQYDGPIPSALGLARPKLTVELSGSAGKGPYVLRIGESSGGMAAATVGTSNKGPVFLLPAAAWDALIPSGSGQEIPANPFAP